MGPAPPIGLHLTREQRRTRVKSSVSTTKHGQSTDSFRKVREVILAIFDSRSESRCRTCWCAYRTAEVRYADRWSVLQYQQLSLLYPIMGSSGLGPLGKSLIIHFVSLIWGCYVGFLLIPVRTYLGSSACRKKKCPPDPELARVVSRPATIYIYLPLISPQTLLPTLSAP